MCLIGCGTAICTNSVEVAHVCVCVCVCGVWCVCVCVCGQTALDFRLKIV